MRTRLSTNRRRRLTFFTSTFLLLSIVLIPNTESAFTYAAYAQASFDGDRDGIPDASEQLLAERYAPVIFIHPNEPNYPVNVDWFLPKTSLEYYEECSPDIKEPALQGIAQQFSRLISQPQLLYARYCTIVPVDDDDCKDCPGTPVCRSLNEFWTHPNHFPNHPGRHCGRPPEHAPISVIDPHPLGRNWETAWVLTNVAPGDQSGSWDPGQWKTYTHVYPSRSGGVIIQYWHLFAFNDYYKNFVGLGGDHGGDWDASIQVELDRQLQPTRTWYSRHAHSTPGDWFAWSSIHTYGGTHPLVAIDEGGHASYQSPYDRDTVSLPTKGDITWTYAPDNPNSEPRRERWPWIGGTVWQAWTGGRVRAYGTEKYVQDGITGGIVNLGEYNPGVRQASPLLAGGFYPLNNQVFILYSGRWGSRGSLDRNSGYPGPVFNGWNGSTYTAWYNEASSAPANTQTHPWIQPRVNISPDPRSIRAGEPVGMVVHAQDQVRNLTLQGKVRIDGDPQQFDTGTPFQYTLHAGPHTITLSSVPGYPDFTYNFTVPPRPWTVTFSPQPVIEGQPLSVTVSAIDDVTGAPVAGNVRITNPKATGQNFPTNTTFPFTFHTDSEIVTDYVEECREECEDDTCMGESGPKCCKPPKKVCDNVPVEGTVELYPNVFVTAPDYQAKNFDINPQARSFKLRVGVVPDTPLTNGQPATVTVFAVDEQTGAQVPATVLVQNPGEAAVEYPANTNFTHTFRATRTCQEKQTKPEQTCETVCERICDDKCCKPEKEVCEDVGPGETYTECTITAVPRGTVRAANYPEVSFTFRIGAAGAGAGAGAGRATNPAALPGAPSDVPLDPGTIVGMPRTGAASMPTLVV